MSIVIFVFGLLTGSFLNAVIHRFHSGESMMEKHSRCVRCGHALSALDLIPLVSFFALAGKCRYCKKSISWIYPLVELATAAAFVLVFVNGLEIIDYRLLFKFTFASFLIVIFVYDVLHYLILDKVVLPALAVAMLFQLLQGNFLGGVIYTVLSSHLTVTPILCNTSIIRYTSSIFGMCFKVVVPRFKRDAHKSATAPFFELLVITVPESFFPP